MTGEKYWAIIIGGGKHGNDDRSSFIIVCRIRAAN